MHFLDQVNGILSLTPFFVTPFLLFFWFKMMYYLFKNNDPNNRFKHFPLKTVLSFSLPIIITFQIHYFIVRDAQNIVHNFIGSTSPSTKVLINNVPYKNPAIYINMISHLQSVDAHHSMPTKKYLLEFIDNKNKLSLILARDSSLENEYWVFYPGYESTRNNEIGRIYTDLLDNIK